MSETTKQCPFCAETIQAAAVVCRFCGRDLSPGAATKAPPPSQRPAPPKRGVVLPVVIIVAVLAVTVVSIWRLSAPSRRQTEAQVYATISAGLGGNEKKIKLEVTGPSRASLTYRNAAGGLEQRDVTLPWSLSFDGRSRQFVSVSAQKKTTSGMITCRITVNGVELQKATSNTSYGIASCSGSVP